MYMKLGYIIWVNNLTPQCCLQLKGMLFDYLTILVS